MQYNATKSQPRTVHTREPDPTKEKCSTLQVYAHNARGMQYFTGMSRCLSRAGPDRSGSRVCPVRG